MNPPSTFQPGQVVQLKSGGPRMTVSGLSAGGDVHCKWFHEGELRQSSFVAEMLSLATDDQPTPQQPSTGWIHVDLHKPSRNQPVVWCKGDACQTSRLGFGHEQPEGFNFWLPVPKISTDEAPSSHNTLCTDHFDKENISLPHVANQLQYVVSFITGLPISIEWVGGSNSTSWFEVSAPLKP